VTVVGVPKEIKNREMRVALTPDAVATLVADGHRVLVEGGSWRGQQFR
jgi:alanine dehydrogenase